MKRLLGALGLAILVAFGFSASFASTLTAVAVPQAITMGLKIVVIEGEDAVNVIRQRTAVAPIVEVRDRNDQPVAGALVTFAIRSGRATFGNARTLSITTNGTGRAVATGLTPTGTGALQISATATFQGQTAVATIAQSNVLTAAATSGAGSTAAGGGSAAAGTGATGTGSATGAAASGAAVAGAGVGAGGGISATTIGVVAGAVAGGTVVATKVAGKNDDADSRRRFTGPLNFQIAFTSGPNCSGTETIVSTMTIDIAAAGDGSATGTGTSFGTTNHTLTCTGAPTQTTTGGYGQPAQDFAGTTANFGYTNVQSIPQTGGTRVNSFTFSGTLSGNVITGTFIEADTFPTVNFQPASGTVTLTSDSH